MIPAWHSLDPGRWPGEGVGWAAGVEASGGRVEGERGALSMARHVMSRHVTSCYVTSCHDMSRDVTWPPARVMKEGKGAM